MSKFDISLTIEADGIQDAINRILYPDGVAVDGVIYISASEAGE